jgi:hypothetical protein
VKSKATRDVVGVFLENSRCFRAVTHTLKSLEKSVLKWVLEKNFARVFIFCVFFGILDQKLRFKMCTDYLGILRKDLS